MGLAESPRFAHEQWVWLDIPKQNAYAIRHTDLLSIHKSQKAQPITPTPLPDEMAAILPTANPQQWLGCGRAGIWLMNWHTQTMHAELIYTAPYDTYTQRFNDAQLDAQGRLWVSTLVDLKNTQDAALYCLTIDYTTLQPKVIAVDILEQQLTVGNGLALHQQQDITHVYLACTAKKTIWRYTQQHNHTALHNKTKLRTYTHGLERPDGAWCSETGLYWVAVLGGGRIEAIDSSGMPVRHIKTPCLNPTMLCMAHDLVLLTAKAEGSPNHGTVWVAARDEF